MIDMRRLFRFLWPPAAGRGMFLWMTCCFGLMLTMVAPADAQNAADKLLPESVPSISMARATWDTGWFQAEVLKKLLEDLGYMVAEPLTMDNRAFYLAAARGEVDLWANGWFPSHRFFLEEDQVRGKVEAVGFEVSSGALQGYLVDKKTADDLEIKSLEDFRNPSIAAVFDRDGNGKADLIGCNVGWGCELAVEHHLDAFALRATVEHIQGDYSPMMDDTIARFKQGQPILFYTWTPNWTVGTLVPGSDVVWIQVPHAGSLSGRQHIEGPPSIPGVPGCVSDPCAMGFPPNDIRVVANKQFLAKHPDVKKLLEQLRIPLADISRQNARMLDGEDAYEDIRRHAWEWIRNNRSSVNTWLGAARDLQSDSADGSTMSEKTAPQPKADALRVVTQRSEPFVIYRDKQYIGFSIELWEKIAQKLGMSYEIYGVNTIAKLLDEVKRGAADVAISGIGITSKREQFLDFSHSFYESGLQIMVPAGSASLLGGVVAKAFSVIFSRELLYGVAIFFFVLLCASHVIWILERRHNPQFPQSYGLGLWHSVWWAVVTVTTVGYGDKTPKGNIGRLFGLVWILAGYFVFAYFTASVTSTVTVQELHGTINGPEDLFGKRVATVARSTASEYLSEQGVAPVEFANADEAYRYLETGKVDAVVYDAPVLQHYASHQGRGRVHVVGLIFQEKSYGIALPIRSAIRDEVNIALLEIIEEGVYQELREKWFGS